MDEMTCPKCSGAMRIFDLGEGAVARCTSCHGIFLDRADLGTLGEAENDWHRDSGQLTQPMPRITADMTVPPPSRPKARSFLDTLFG